MSGQRGVISPDAKNVIISVNPKAGRKSPKVRVERLKAALEGLGQEVEVMTDLVEVANRTNALFDEGKLRALVGVGGDGTAAELVNRTKQGVPVTLMAAGTANLISKYLKLTGSPERLAKIIADGCTLNLDAGRAGERLFLVMVSCGFDAYVVQGVHARRESNPKGAHISYFSYLKPIWNSIRSYRYPAMRIESHPDDVASGEANGPLAIDNARWAFAFNLPCYGWGLPLTPKAVGTDGVFDLCTFSGPSLFSGAKYVLAAHCGHVHSLLPDCRLSRSKRFRITSDEADVPFQLDGDPGGTLPVDIEMLPGRLTFIVPEKIQRRFGVDDSQ